MNAIKPEVAQLFVAKEQRRHKLAKLPVSAKVQIVVSLQQMVAPVLRARGRSVNVWKLDKASR